MKNVCQADANPAPTLSWVRLELSGFIKVSDCVLSVTFCMILCFQKHTTCYFFLPSPKDVVPSTTFKAPEEGSHAFPGGFLLSYFKIRCCKLPIYIFIYLFNRIGTNDIFKGTNNI